MEKKLDTEKKGNCLLDKLVFSKDVEDGPLCITADFAFTSTDGLFIKNGEETTLVAAFDNVNKGVLVVDEIIVTKTKVTARFGRHKLVVNV